MQRKNKYKYIFGIIVVLIALNTIAQVIIKNQANTTQVMGEYILNQSNSEMLNTAAELPNKVNQQMIPKLNQFIVMGNKILGVFQQFSQEIIRFVNQTVR